MRAACLIGLVTAILALAAWLAWRSEPTVTPWATLQPASPIATAATPATAPPDAIDPSAGPVAGERQAASPTAPGAAQVEILVLAPDEAPWPAIDVRLEIEPDGGELMARTDARGIAHLAVHVPPGTRLCAHSAAGGETHGERIADATTRLVVRIAARVFVRGRVVDSGGRGVAAAELWLLGWPESDDDVPMPMQVGRSGDDGSFALPLGKGGRLGARHPDFGPSPMHLVRVAAAPSAPPRADTISLELVLSAEPASLVGTVTTAEGAPIADADVEWRSRAPAPRGTEGASLPSRARSDAQGAFTLPGLGLGQGELGVRANGHGSVTQGLTLERGERRAVRVVMTAPCTLTGRVLDERGEPIAHATVIAGPADAFVRRSVRTDARGEYAIADLTAGAIPVQASAPAPNGVRRIARAELVLQPGTGNQWNPTLQPPEATTELRGSVLDPQRRPLAGWRVLARVANGRSGIAQSDAQGAFAIAVPTGSRVDVRLYAPGQPPTGFADAVVRDVDPARGPIELIGGAGTRGTVRGRVVTEAQLPVPATLELWHHERAEYVRTTAATDGTFRIDVPTGVLDATFAHPGQAGTRRPDVPIAVGEDRDLGTVQLASAGVLHGNVRGPDGRPVDGCSLVILHDGQRLQADCANGSYRFAALPRGQHTLMVQAPGLAAATFEVQIAAGEEKLQDIVLAAGVLRHVHVRAAPPGVGQIALAVRAGERGVQWMSTQSPPVGSGPRLLEAHFEAWLPTGDYELVAWSGDSEARATVQFTGDDSSPVTLVLQPK